MTDIKKLSEAWDSTLRADKVMLESVFDLLDSLVAAIKKQITKKTSFLSFLHGTQDVAEAKALAALLVYTRTHSGSIGSVGVKSFFDSDSDAVEEFPELTTILTRKANDVEKTEKEVCDKIKNGRAYELIAEVRHFFERRQQLSAQ